ncbi:MAG: complex I subunit 5 family protein [Candidatus Krumholzibacteriia bacterium]
MTGLLLITLPLAAALATAAWPGNRTRPLFLPAVGLAHAGISCALLAGGAPPPGAAWLGFDPVARATLPALSLLFLVCALYGVPYLAGHPERGNRTFVSCLLLLLGLLSLAIQSLHLGLYWIAIEGATLATVPLLHFNRTPRAYEATWKYLLVGGTGIALSLLGTFFLGYASLFAQDGGDLTFSALAAQGTELSRPWVRAGWVLLLVGYGTKMGLAPMHTWKPDAYGEASGMVGALLAGGLTTVAFVGILRVKQVVAAAGEGEMAARTLLTLGLLSMAVAALFLLSARHFKRMLAYSSVEHMGILGIGAALGGAGLWAALFHVWANGLTKGALFLSAGNLRRALGRGDPYQATGLAALAPWSTRIFVTGIFAVTAMPPFAPFFSELRVVREAFAGGRTGVAIAFLACLLLAFCGLTRRTFSVADGRPDPGSRNLTEPCRESAAVLVPPLALLAASAYLGLFTPDLLRQVWTAAVAALEAAP